MILLSPECRDHRQIQPHSVIYTYVCVCVCMYVYVCMCVCMYMCVCVCVCVFMNVCVHVCMCICVCMYVCVCSCMYVWMCVGVCTHQMQREQKPSHGDPCLGHSLHEDCPSLFYLAVDQDIYKARRLIQLLVLVSRKPRSVVLAMQVCVRPGLLSFSYKATSLIMGS